MRAILDIKIISGEQLSVWTF